MTREEARIKLIEIRAQLEVILSMYGLEISEVFYRAIKALEQEPKFIVKSDGTIEQIKDCDDCVFKKEWEKIGKLLSVILEKHTKQDPILEKIKSIVFEWQTDTWTDNLSCECMLKIADIVTESEE